MRTYLADQLNHVELISCNRRVGQLSEIADLRDDPAEAIVLLHRRAKRFFGYVHAQLLLQRRQDFIGQLDLIVVQIDLITLHRWINLRDEEELAERFKRITATVIVG